jgi:hypothetical protein
MYAGVDGVMVPTINDAEKQQRRKKVLEKRRKRGRKCKPLPPRKKVTNNAWKEFKMVTFYNQDQSRRHLRLSRCRRPQTGVLVRREAQQLGLSRADEKVAIVDGASWISQMLEGKQHALQLDAVGLDFYHLSENVHKTRRAVFGEDDAGFLLGVEMPAGSGHGRILRSRYANPNGGGFQIRGRRYTGRRLVR